MVDGSDFIKKPALNSDAKFLGWQKDPLGKDFPLYTITIADHPLYRSTVSDVTLRKLGLRIPRTLDKMGLS